MNKPLVIHVGLSKTATTTLQRAVFEKHSQIYYLGKIYKSPHPRQCISTEVHDFLSPLLWKLDQSLDADAHRRFFSETLQPAARTSTVILGSWEGLGDRDAASFETSVTRLAEVTGGCKLMMSLRNPINRLPSNYLQHLRGNQKQLADRFVSFEEWLDQYSETRGGFDELFIYSQNIETAIRILGKEKVGIFVYEEYQAKPEQYLQRVSAFLGVEAEETIRLADNQHLHTRLFDSQVEKMKELDSSFLGRLLWRLSNVDLKKKLVGFSDTESVIESSVSGDKPASVDLSADSIQRITEASREDHQWLVNNLQLDLEQYDYPL